MQNSGKNTESNFDDFQKKTFQQKRSYVSSRLQHIVQSSYKPNIDFPIHGFRYTTSLDDKTKPNPFEFTVGKMCVIPVIRILKREKFGQSSL